MFSDFFNVFFFTNDRMLNLHLIQFARFVCNYAHYPNVYIIQRIYYYIKNVYYLSLTFTTDGMFLLVTFFGGCIRNASFRLNSFKLYCVVLNMPGIFATGHLQPQINQFKLSLKITVH